MNDLDTLRPEVAQALGFIERNQKYGDGSVCAGDIDIIRAELLRLADENADLTAQVFGWKSECGRAAEWKKRAEAAEAELAALKAKIFQGIVLDVDDLALGHAGLPSEWRGKRVRLFVEE